MKNKLKSPVGLNPMGVGPKIFKYSLPFIIGGIVLGIFFPELCSFAFMDGTLRIITGITLLLSGTVLYLLTIKHFMQHFASGKLIIDGVYRFSRNPLYASWILLLLPSVSFLTDNWTFLSAPVAMYLLFSIFIHEEEKNLLQIFGQEYETYSKKVNRFIGFSDYKSKIDKI